VRCQTFEIRNGRFDTLVTVMDEEGELVALGKHVSVVFSKKSPEELRKIYRL
jgi:hypothetical protein